MSQEVKTPALILQRYPFRERSWIIRLHTPKEGTISTLLSGRRGAAILPGALMQVCLRLRPTREVQRLTEIEWHYMYRRFFHEPAHTAYLFLIVEWLNQCLYGPDPLLFDWVRNQLIELDSAENPELSTRNLLSELLCRLGGSPPPSSASLPDIEKAYQAFFPYWKPIRSLNLTTFASL
ncbi:MAG: recombination protein O N-terminal domain-containing protein [Bacteroidia bacterium]|nr:recombination protein O N-terminal domain-containing protein [Bacteroidia bacterium]